MATTPMNATPFFGSKISLISKSEIRYEGILYTVDPKESTIALAQVRSFGSEDRQVEKPVPPRDEIFQYIIFRASDIKDLIVDQPPSPALTDPAIIQAPSSLNAGQSSSSIQQQLQAGIQNAAAAMAAAAQMPKSSSNTTQQQSAPSTGVSVQNIHDSNKANKTTASIAQVVASGSSNSGGNVQHKQQSQQGNKQQQQLPQRSTSNQMNRQQHSHNQQNNRSNQQHHDGTGASGGSAGNTGGNFIGNRNNNFNRRMNVSRNISMNGGGGGFQRNVSNFNNRNFNNRFQPRQQNTGFYSYNRRQNNRNFLNRSNPKPSISVPETEFDFEKAQDEFKQLEEKLANLKVNGDASSNNLATSSTSPETTNTEQQQQQPATQSVTKSNNTDATVSKDPCYNKEKSFFDKISCESLERERGNVQRVDWKAERKLNRETFGVVAPMRRNNGFRPNNRFSGGGHGGGFRSYQNYRNRSSGQHNSSNSTGSGSNKPSNGLSTNSNAVSSSGGPSTSNATTSVVAATSSSIVVAPAKN